MSDDIEADPTTLPVQAAPLQPVPGTRDRAPPPRAGSPRAAAAVLWLLALAALAAAAFALWRVEVAERGRPAALNAARDQLNARIDALNQTVQQRTRDLDGLRTRLADADSVDKSVREELLALGERSRHLEDAVANLAEQRQSGRDALAMNEAEFLLQQAQERLALFRDAQAAATAYRLADSALAAAEDPVFASVRQTISAELRALDAARPAETKTALATLERIRGELPTLPLPHAADEAAAAGPSRWQALLDQFVRISHDNAVDATSQREVGLTRALAALDLREAEAALLAAEPAAFTAAVKRARDAVAALFENKDAAVAAALAQLDQLGARALPAPAPELGSALKELRNLRATRALAKPSTPAAAAPAATAPDFAAPASAPVASESGP